MCEPASYHVKHLSKDDGCRSEHWAQHRTPCGISCRLRSSCRRCKRRACSTSSSRCSSRSALPTQLIGHTVGVLGLRIMTVLHLRLHSADAGKRES